MSDLITEKWDYGNNDLVAFDQDNHDGIRNLLLGHKITKIADDHLELDDGTVVRVVPNEGGCACDAGDYVLDDLNGCDNIITAVDFEVGSEKNADYEFSGTYRVFVVAEDKRINLFAVSGDDGNGYYGTGYELLVRYET